MILAMIFVVSTFFSMGATAFAEEAEATPALADEIVDETLEAFGPEAAEETAAFDAAEDEIVSLICSWQEGLE